MAFIEKRVVSYLGKYIYLNFSINIYRICRVFMDIFGCKYPTYSVNIYGEIHIN